MTDPALTAWFDQQRRSIAETIRRHGCSLAYVSESGACACCAATTC